MNERIKKLRRALDLTQQEFADRIGSKRTTIAKYETGTNIPSSAVISLICREFKVSETWLRTGEGEMFVEAPNDTLDTLAREYHLDRFGQAVVEKMLNLNEKQWEAFRVFALDVLKSLGEEERPEVERTEQDAPASVPVVSLDHISRAEVEAEVRAEAEEYYAARLKEKIQELQASSVNDTEEKMA